MDTTIVYIWGNGPSAPEAFGNATREHGVDYDDYATNAAKSARFDVEAQNRDGKPAWAAAYNYGDATDFDPGADRPKFVDFTKP